LFAVDKAPGPRDLALTYHSDIDDTDQPYRIYLPSAYDGKSRLPLLIALHGTGGDQNKYSDHAAYGNGIYKKEAEKRGIAIVCPHGRGTTEYRGMGENDVLNVIEEVSQRFLVDRDRIVCSGQSMGGTGTTYLCCRYPDVFAAGIPLASTYGHLTLIENLRHVPMFYVQGAKDWPVYAQDGPIPIVKRLKELDYENQLWMIPGQGHNTMRVGGWVATVEPRRLRPYTAYRTHKIGQVVNPPSPAGRAETRLGSWVTDMIRDATGADIAIATGRHYRGVPVKPGQEVYLVDLLNLLRPSNRILVRFQMDGKGLLEILTEF